jgi:protein TonB
VQTASLNPQPSIEAAPKEAPEIRLGDGAAGPLAEILDKNGLIRRAEADNGNLPPSYPLDAARRGEQGTVTLRLTIGTDGGVLDAEVAKSSGSPRLDRAALTRIETWHFKPAMRDGKPQIDVIEFGVEFRLN